MKTFYHIRQNNSGGKFKDPAVNILVEASTRNEACERAEKHIQLCGDSGAYAEYDYCGCCPCCGHRWGKPYTEQPEEADEIARVIGNSNVEYMGKPELALIRSNGEITVATTQEQLNEIKSYCIQP